MWQELRTELQARGTDIEIVTVALDTAGAEAARPFVEQAGGGNVALIDEAHLMGALFGVVNVPNAVWIDERGMIVRPAEPAFPGRSPVIDEIRQADLGGGAAGADAEAEGSSSAGLSLMNQIRGVGAAPLPPALVEQLRLTQQIVIEAELYREMILDWAEHGAASRFVLPAEEVVSRSNVRSLDQSRAAAHFELGQHRHGHGDHPGAIGHWREAHRLHPENWTYKRQAWRFEAGPGGDPSLYDSNWTADVRAIGPENYYPRLEVR